LIADSFVRPVPAVVTDASAVIEGIVRGDERVLAYFASTIDASGLLLAPPHFWSEVANGLFNRRRNALDTASDLQAVARIGISVADRGLAGINDTVALADRHRLTIYDAAYLHLALDVDGELATYDRALADAARAEGVLVRP
jgi:predicted nucleic acid-binding protein